MTSRKGAMNAYCLGGILLAPLSHQRKAYWETEVSKHWLFSERHETTLLRTAQPTLVLLPPRESQELLSASGAHPSFYCFQAGFIIVAFIMTVK